MKTTKLHTPLKSFFVVILLIIIVFLIGSVTISRISASMQVDRLISFAQSLDYTPNAHLAQYKTCWGIFPTHCGEVLYYVISLNREQFQTRINQVFLAAGLPNESDGYTLLDINLVTKHRVSIDGRTDSLNRALTPEPTAYSWHSTEGGNYWVITFYETTQDGHIYKMDDKPIIGNIITIMLRTK